MNVQNLFALTQSFYYLLIQNMYYISLTPGTNYRVKTGNNIIEFTHSKWIMQSYFSSPKYKSLIPKYISLLYTLEHGYAIVTESFSLLNLNYITSFVRVQIRSGMTSHTIPDTVDLPCALNSTANQSRC